MGLFGDRYVGEYRGHTVELLRNNWNKTLKLFVDGHEVAGDTCHFPATIRLTASLVNDGVTHEVVAKSTPCNLVFTKDTVEIDGEELPLTYENPKGITPAWAISLFAIAGVGLLIAGVAILLGRIR